jgi:hypothetical protein
MYSLGGLLCGRGVLPKSMRLPLNSFFFGGFYDINGSGLITKSWNWNVYDLAIKTSSSGSRDVSFSSSGSSL